jgi:Grx4 family monothiol glutaredoxin
MLSRLTSRVAPRLALLPASHLARVPQLGAGSSRLLSDGIHDDFKPQKRSYANETDDIAAQIAKDVAEHKVVVFMKGVPDAPQCGFSNAVVQVMKAEGVEFKGFNVLADPDLREGIKAFSAWPTIPQASLPSDRQQPCGAHSRACALCVRAAAHQMHIRTVAVTSIDIHTQAPSVQPGLPDAHQMHTLGSGRGWPSTECHII